MSNRTRKESLLWPRGPHHSRRYLIFQGLTSCPGPNPGLGPSSSSCGLSRLLASRSAWKALALADSAGGASFCGRGLAWACRAGGAGPRSSHELMPAATAWPAQVREPGPASIKWRAGPCPTHAGGIEGQRAPPGKVT